MNQDLNLKNEYKSRINRVIDYIDNHIEKQFTLSDLAAVASFSKFHFHRIFQAHIGETPFQFIMRIRLEKAASLIISSRNETITEIALKCGFTDISVFSRNFRNYFSVSATQYRKDKFNKSNISQAEGNNSKAFSNDQQEKDKPSMYFCHSTKTIKWRTNMKLNKSVEVKELPKMTLAYVRHIGPYKGDAKLFERLWGKLCTWADTRGLMQQPDLKFLVIYHDDPNVTVEDKLRMSVCLSVPENTKVDGEIGRMELEAAKYVIARFIVSSDEFQQAWQWVYGQWFPESGYQPDDKPCFEMYPEEPKDGKFTVDICVPVKPL